MFEHNNRKPEKIVLVVITTLVAMHIVGSFGWLIVGAIYQ